MLCFYNKCVNIQLVKGTVWQYGSCLSAINITSSQQNNGNALQNKCLVYIKIKMACSSDLEPR